MAITRLPSLAVTGSTGAVGGMVARELASRGIAQRLVVRDPSRAPDLEGSTVVVTEYGDAEAARDALDGVETLLMVSAAEAADRLQQHFTFVDAAMAAGVTRIVYTSFVAAAADSTFTLGRDHWATEERIRGSGMAYTFLRDNFYLDFMPMMVSDGAIRGPAGNGRVAAVARRDVADVAIAVLISDGAFDGQILNLTGPESLTLGEVALQLGAHTGSPVAYVNETLAEAYASRASYGAPDWQVDAWVSTYTAIASGDVEAVSDDIARVTGRRATSLDDLLSS